jgi:hypothetical protein
LGFVEAEVGQRLHRLADHALGQVGEHRLHDRVGAHPHRLGEQRVVLPRDRDQIPGLPGGQRHRLLAEDRDPGLQRGPGDRVVLWVRSTDVEDVHGALVDQPPVVVVAVLDAELVGETVRVLQRSRRHSGGHGLVAELGDQVLREGGGDVASSNDSPADTIYTHCLNSGVGNGP